MFDKNLTAVFESLGGASTFVAFISLPALITIQKLLYLVPCRKFFRTIAIKVSNWFWPYAYYQTLEGQDDFPFVDRYLGSNSFLLIYHIIERGDYGKGVEWSPSLFHHKHQGMFDTLAIDGSLSRSIRADLVSVLSNTANLRIYHIYGPMGVGKMTTIACMAQHLRFDIYLIHLSCIKSCASLRRFLKETKEMSIIVFDMDTTEDGSVSLESILRFVKSEWYPAGGRLVIFKSRICIDSLMGKVHLDIPLTYLTPKGFKLLAQIHANLSSGSRYERALKIIGEVDVTAGEVVELFQCQPEFLRSQSRLQVLLAVLEQRSRNKPKEIYVDDEDEAKLTLHGLVQHYINLSELEKNRKLNDLLDALDFNEVVIFVKSVSRAAEVNKLLVGCNFPSICIHSEMSQEERTKYKGLEEGHKRILVGTDLVGRGIDIERVNIVINYDMPDSADTYLHRVGRAGRFGTKGLAITFVSSASDSDVLNQVESRFEVDIKELPLPEEIDTATYMPT